MAIDRTLTLRPGVIDIADAVDALQQALSAQAATISALENSLDPVIYDSSILTFSNGFEPYDETSPLNKIVIVKQLDTVYITGSVRKVGDQETAGDIVIANIPDYLLPKTRKNVMNGATGMNRYMMTVNPSSAMYAQRFGTDSLVIIPNNTWLRIDIVYNLN